MRDGRYVPQESFYSNLWHLQQLGGIEKVWFDYRGEGIKVAVYDSGVQFNHYDLNDNYDTSLHIVVNGVTRNAFADGSRVGDNAHGTSCAGIIGADLDGIGMVGVAFECRLTGVNFNGPGGLGGTALESEALWEMDNFDVVNLSLALRTSAFGDNFLAGGELTADGIAIKHCADAGRAGLGTNIVVAAGNLWLDDGRAYLGDPNHYNLQNSRYTISVAAFADVGFVSTYSSKGAANLVAAPSNGSLDGSMGLEGILTTDFLGPAGSGEDPRALDYNTEFGGTSASAPIVSGVVALMLDANPGLGWRDVQDILANTAQHVGSALVPINSPVFTEAYGWSFNGAGQWNGGAMHFSNDYGFGAVDAFAAVRYAEAWTLFRGARTSTNEAHASSAVVNVNMNTIDGGTAARSIGVAQDIDVDQVEIQVRITHSHYNDIRITLISPDGTQSIIQDFTDFTGFGASIPNIADGGLSWVYTSNAFRGESSAGTWQVRVTDLAGGGIGTLNQVQLRFHGDAQSANDVYHYTQEIYDLISLNPARRSIVDNDAGVDWLNFAAFEDDLRLDLNANGNLRAAGILVGTLGATTKIENVVGGDGEDLIFGNALVNHLVGARGGDELLGRAGNDRLDGRQGADELYGEGDNDTLLGGLARDRLDGGFGNDSLDGGGGRDKLVGGRGVDTLTGGTDSDFFIFLTASDSGLGANRDQIRDFSRTQGDKIDVSNLDARADLAGDQAFTVGNLAVGQRGRLDIDVYATTNLVRIDFNGDGVADMEFLVTRGATALAASDFIL